MIVSKNKLEAVSFHDYEVISYQIDMEAKHLHIVTDGAYLDLLGGLDFDHAELTIDSWESFSLHYYCNDNDELYPCPYDYDELKDICEFEISNKDVYLRGFGRYTGKWLEIKITGTQIQIKLW